LQAKITGAVCGLLLASIILSACAPGATSTPAPLPTKQATLAATTAPVSSPTLVAAPIDDLLNQIMARGTIRISTDPNYEPQSLLVPDARRPANTQCGDDQLTSNQMKGFDIDAAIEIARRLGVEACFVRPPWSVITAGSWGNEWDISVGSVAITKPRQQVLWFSPGYYYAPAQFAVRVGSAIQSVNDLNGQTICVGSATTYETYLNGKLDIPNSDIKTPAPIDVTIVALNTDADCVASIKAGGQEFDVILTSATVVDQAIANGVPISKLGSPAFVENLAVALDKRSAKDPKQLLEAISRIINDMHNDGTLKAASLKWFQGIDLTTPLE
jgi:ABC-type amino acid transport substrate-binding protein